jgi:hypothetical protein
MSPAVGQPYVINRQHSTTRLHVLRRRKAGAECRHVGNIRQIANILLQDRHGVGPKPSIAARRTHASYDKRIASRQSGRQQIFPAQRGGTSCPDDVVYRENRVSTMLSLTPCISPCENGHRVSISMRPAKDLDSLGKSNTFANPVNKN